jgi:hypothetical protein
MSKTIEIIVSPDGKLRVEAKGFVGAECREASRLIERALGQQTDEQLTGEFYATQTEQQPLREQS